MPKSRFERSTASLSAVCDRYSVLLFGLLTAWYAALVWPLLRRPLWSDELFSFYIAQQPSVGRMLQAIHTIDLNPPLNFLLTRWSIELFGPSPWATRLPAVVGYWIGSVALFVLLRRKTSTLFSAVGVLLLWSNPFFSYAAEARPYALVLGLTATLVLGWVLACDGERHVGLALVILSGVLLLLSHIFGTLSLGALWVAEGVRSYRRHRLDTPMLVALLLPLAAIVTYAPMFHAFGQTLFPAQAQASWGKLAFLYYATFRWMWRPLLAIAVVAYLFRSKASPQREALPFRVLMGLLFLVPVAVTLVFLRTHAAFYERYGIVCVLSIVVIAVLLLWRFTGASASGATVALLCVASLLLLSTALRVPVTRAVSSIMAPRAATKAVGMLTTSVHGPFRAWWTKLPLPPQLMLQREHAPMLNSFEQVQGDLPIVVASELTFLELDHREGSGSAERLVYLYDREAEVAIAHRSVANGMVDVQQYFPLRGKVDAYADFVSEHRKFLVFGQYENPGDWLLRKLQSDGASIQIIAHDPAYDSDLFFANYPNVRQKTGEAEASPDAQR